MSTETQDLGRIIRASVHDMLDVYRIQARVGPVSEQALEGIIFRAAHPVVNSLAPYRAEQRAALLPNVVRVMLAAFLENDARPRLLIDRLRRDEATASPVNPVRGPRSGRRSARGPSEGQR